MTLAVRHLREDITYWPYTGPDTYGGYAAFGTAVIIKGRWEDVDHVEELSSSREETSNAKVYLDTDVQIGDYLARGDLTAQADPTVVSGAWKIRDYHRQTDLRNLETIRKAVL